MTILIISNKERDQWQQEVEQINNKDIYFSLDYCNLYREIGEGDPHLFIYKDNKGNKILYPFLKRRINQLPFVQDRFGEDLFDIITPYGYGGPIGHLDHEEAVRNFRLSFEEYCQNENIISEFVRFHPLLHNQKNLEDFLCIQHIRNTVSIDVSLSEEEIFKNCHKSHQRNIKKGIMRGLQFQVLDAANAVNHLDMFLRLYKETMERRNASSYYYFPESYYLNLFTNLANHALLVFVSIEDRILSTAIFMYQGDYLHYHLGGSDREYLNLAPNNFLFYHAALWGKQKGCKMLHLGGGYQNNDSLYQFKSRFNPHGILKFYIGKKIHNKPVYDELVRLRSNYDSKETDANFFPSYRQI